jgi:hypothetical protein
MAEVTKYFTDTDWAQLRRAALYGSVWEGLDINGQESVRKLVYYGYLALDVHSIDWKITSTSKGRAALDEAVELTPEQAAERDIEAALERGEV